MMSLCSGSMMLMTNLLSLFSTMMTMDSSMPLVMYWVGFGFRSGPSSTKISRLCLFTWFSLENEKPLKVKGSVESETLENMVGKSQKSNGGTETVKFLYSYGGKILPRCTDGKLRYVGGETRILAVDRSISFSELLVKFGVLCGCSMRLRCQLPNEDLDALVSITSDEDLANVIEEYDLASKEKLNPEKIKVFLSPRKSIEKSSPPSSVTSSVTDSPPSKYSPRTTVGHGRTSIHPVMAANGCVHQSSRPVEFPVCYKKSVGTQPLYYAYIPHQGNRRQLYGVHDGNHWQ